MLGWSGGDNLVVPETLPRVLTARLLEFCRSISAEQPRFIASRPSKDALLDYCYDNVSRKISRAGGSLVCGWAIWQTKGVYFDAVHHCVWRKRSGETLDVSPQQNNYNKILFLHDETSAFDPLNVRDSLFAPDSDDPLALEFVFLAKRRTQIHNSYKSGGAMFAFFSNADQAELDQLNGRMGEIMRMLGIKL